MELHEVIRRRRMVRSFTSDPIDEAAVERLATVALRAPSAGYSQGTEVVVLHGQDDTERLWGVTFSPEGRERFTYPGLFRAPLIVVPLSCRDAYLDRYAEPDKGWTDREERRWPVPYWDVDAGMAAMLVLLTAVDLGLGALFFAIMPPHIDGFREEFGVPARYTPIGAIAIGHAAPDDRRSGSPERRGRRPAHARVHWGGFTPVTAGSPEAPR